MISKILKLQNVGLLQDATQDGAVALGKVAAIYADNGRGKSTLTAVLRACQLGDAGRVNARKTIDSANSPEVRLLLPAGSHVEFTASAWTAKLPDIVIFDAEFVEQNVYSGFEVRADQRQSLLEFALGDQTVPLQKQILQLTQEIAAQTQKRSQAEKTLTGFAPPYSVAQFIALQPVPDAQQRIDELHKRIEAAKSAPNLATRKDPTEIAPIQFDAAAVFAVLKTQLKDVEEASAEVVRAHLAKHGADEFEDWLSRGQSYSAGVDCPFCGRNLDGLALIDAYRSYFGQAYAALKRQIAELEPLVADGLADAKIQVAVSLAATNAARIEAWKDQLKVAAPALEVGALGAGIKEVREQLLALIGAKQKAPLDSVSCQADAEKVATSVAEINQAIATYNAETALARSQITAFKKELESESTAALIAEVRKLEAAQKRVSAEVVTAVVDYKAAEAERNLLDGKKTLARQQLDTQMHATLQQYQQSINDLLVTFGAEFSIEQLKPTYLGGGEPRSEYGLSVRKKSVKLGSRSDIASDHSFASTLSEADKRTLAFAFFLARVKADPKLSSKLVVLDDPVASLDRNRRYESTLHIANLAADCEQLLVLSHDAFFIRELRERLGELKPAPLVPKILVLRRVGKGYSAFAACDIDDLCASDYYRHHRLVADYVDGKSTCNTRDVAKAIRPLLEGYYHRRFPGEIPRKLMFGQVIAFAGQAPAGAPLAFLQPILEEMGEVNDYAGRFQHDTNPGFVETVPVVDGELLTFANRALRLIYQNG